ncbi:MAG: HlyD family efflux transporter periplasmic adaptor subunit [Hyphomicrobiales bacterium]
MKPNPRRIVPIGVLVIVLAVALAIWVKGRGANGPIDASGTVEATEVDLGFPVPGRLDSLGVDEGDTVSAGQVLARLDLGEMEAQREQAKARVAAAKSLLLELTRGTRPEEVEQAKAAAKAADDRLTDAQRDGDRARTLFAAGAISQEALDKATTTLDVAQSQATQAREAYRQAVSGPRREQIAAQRAAVAQAEAAVQQIDVTLAHMHARAPFAGVVTAKHREKGEIVPAGSPVVTVRNRNDRWVRIYVPERQIGRVALGAPAEIRTDSDPKHAYRGTVVFIATQAEFTPRSVQTKEERVRLVYAVKVRIEGDPEFRLKPGMPADVRIAAGGSATATGAPAATATSGGAAAGR